MQGTAAPYFVSIENLRERATVHLIPIAFVALFFSMVMSLLRAPQMGFWPLMEVQIVLLVGMAAIHMFRRRLPPYASAWAMIAIFFTIMATGVFNLGLLSAAVVLAPGLTLFVLLLGYRKTAYAVIAVNAAFLAVTGYFFVTGAITAVVPPEIYMRSPVSWGVLIAVLSSVSVVFVLLFQLLPLVLQSNADRLSEIFEQSISGICVTTPEGKFVRVNPGLCTMLGYTREELEQLTLSDVTHSGDQVRGGEDGAEQRFIRKDGQIVWALVAHSAVQATEHRPSFHIRHLQDVTLRKQGEELLRKSEERFRAVVEKSSEAVALVDSDGKIVYESPNAVRISGFTASERIGASGRLGLHPDDLPRVSALFAKMLQEGEGAALEKFEFKGCRPDGTVWHGEATATNLLQDPAVGAVVINYRDVTERKRADDDIRASEELYRKLISASPDAISITDSAGILVLASPEALRLFGVRSQEEAIGLNVMSWVSPADRDNTRMALAHLLKTGEFTTMELSLLRMDGTTFLAEVHAALIREADGSPRGTIIITRDVTERRKAEAARHSLELQLYQAQRLESIGTLAAGIAHDFNNILGAIVGNAELIIEGSTKSEFVAERARRISVSSDRGARLVRQLMTLARKSELDLRSVDVNGVVEETSRLLYETLPKSCVITLRLAPGILTVTADANQISQVLLNLCFNSRDAMPSGGTIAITTSVRPGSFVCIDIEDTGTGMDEETMGKIFDPFFTTKDVGKGTGLGLSVALGIIQRHNGFIEVSSRPGRGSRFTVILPEATHPGAATTGLPVEIHAVRGGDETILFIEDEAPIREIHVAALANQGYTVLAASNGEEAVEVFSQNQDRIAIVLSDFGLPKLNGEEVYVRVRAMKPMVPFVLLSGFVSLEKREEFLAMGMRRILSKPYRSADILKLIREVLDPPRAGAHPPA
jgi:two-component system, cell cycle sensor histidine kinase and response regulator CckA